MLKNPIIEELVIHLLNGKEVRRIHPDASAGANKKVTFFFGDNSSSVLQTDCDHKTFMRWWRHLDSFLRMARKVQDVKLPK
jgi:hypothetical protein